MFQGDVFAGMPRENLLLAVLEALSGPAVSYIGLGFDTDVTLASGQVTAHWGRSFAMGGRGLLCLVMHFHGDSI